MGLFYTFKLFNLVVSASLSVAGVLALGIVYPAIAEQACVRTNAGNVVCGTLVPRTTSQDTSMQSQRVESYGLRFELQNCTRSGALVNCTLLITNTQQGDMNVELYSSKATGMGGISRSRAISTLGEEFSTKNYQLGNSDSEGLWWKISNTLVAGIPTRASFTFENVTPQNSEFALIEIGFNTTESNLRWSPKIGQGVKL